MCSQTFENQAFNGPALNHGFDASNVVPLLPGYSGAIHAANESHPHVPVALILDRGLNLSAAQFSVLSLGRFFLPIDPCNPVHRIIGILEDSAADIIVVDHSTKHLVEDLTNSVIVDLSEIQAPDCALPPQADIDQAIRLNPYDLAYMIYTSGSTGRPKGVPVHWSALDNHNHWFINQFQLTPEDRCTQVMSPGFDVSIQDIFPVLRSGASLYPATKELLADPYQFLRWIEANQLTVLSFPTALWHTIVPLLSKHALPESVRLVIIGGEKVNPDLVRQWFEYVDSDRVRLTNLYGPTEVTIASTCCELSPKENSSIGKPIDNIDAHILDEANTLITKPGVTGELILSGAGVVQGYWNRPDLTEQAFFQSKRLDHHMCYRTGDLAYYNDLGELHFVGRKDNQVKLRGFRIELDEIALAIEDYPQVADVVVRKISKGHEFIACFVIPATTSVSQTEFEEGLRNHLKEIFPEYMIPSVFKFVDHFPTTVGGKVDHNRLIDLLAGSVSFTNKTETNLTETEQQIINVWQSILGRPPASIDSTFEDSGGDSLAAITFITKLKDEFNLSGIGLATIAANNTVKRLASFIDHTKNNRQTQKYQPLVTRLNPSGSTTPSSCLILFHPTGGGGYFYYDLLTKDILDKYTVMIVESPFLTCRVPKGTRYSIPQIALQYYKSIVQELDTNQKIVTAGYSFGGLLAWEFGKLLKHNNFEIDQVINIDQPVPSSIQYANPKKRLCNWWLRLKYPLIAWQELIDAKNCGDSRTAHKHNRTNLPNNLSHVNEIENFYRSIEQDYLPQSSSLEMKLIKCQIFQAKYKLDDDYGWTGLTKSLQITQLPGWHSTLFHKKLIKGLRTAFTQCLPLLEKQKAPEYRSPAPVSRGR